MALLKLETNVALSADTRKSLLETLSKIVAETIGKPEKSARFYKLFVE
jgi:hypothetical protein